MIYLVSAADGRLCLWHRSDGSLSLTLTHHTGMPLTEALAHALHDRAPIDTLAVPLWTLHWYPLLRAWCHLISLLFTVHA